MGSMHGVASSQTLYYSLQWVHWLCLAWSAVINRLLRQNLIPALETPLSLSSSVTEHCF